MSLAPGTRLGPYELQALVGSGGMGQVSRARDTRLDRTIAIKVLASLPGEHDLSPGAPSRNARLRERFDREARGVSRLNHPHICTLHDIGREGAIDFLVMEYVDGRRAWTCSASCVGFPTVGPDSTSQAPAAVPARSAPRNTWRPNKRSAA